VGTSQAAGKARNAAGIMVRETGSPLTTALRGDADFKAELVTLVPQLRAFARSLCGHRDLADDLVQESMLKAWGARNRFQAGTNLRAWTFVILRNIFLSQKRRARFTGAWDDSLAARVLSMPPSQEHNLQVGDMQRALLCLPVPQREALILVAAGDFSYEEAAQICSCAVGTIKSRVARARKALERMFVEDVCPPRTNSRAPASNAAEAIIREANRIAASRVRLGAGSAVQVPMTMAL
jgi:RNA polymerase sigma factor (sigma-70 family)